MDSPTIKTLTKNLVVIISVVPLQLVEVLWQRGGPAVRSHPAHALQGLVLHRGRVGHRAVEGGLSIIINSGQIYCHCYDVFCRVSMFLFELHILSSNIFMK